jgi:hypothetical protein
MPWNMCVFLKSSRCYRLSLRFIFGFADTSFRPRQLSAKRNVRAKIIVGFSSPRRFKTSTATEALRRAVKALACYAGHLRPAVGTEGLDSARLGAGHALKERAWVNVNASVS